MKEIEYLETPSTYHSQERINSETQDKINEIIDYINSKKDQLL